MSNTRQQDNFDGYPELDLGINLSKAEGNLNFLARASNEPAWKGTMTQGEAILDAVHAVQEARKKLQDMLYKQRKQS